MAAVSLRHLARAEAVRVGYGQQETAYASTISLVFFLLVLAVSLVQHYLTRERE